MQFVVSISPMVKKLIIINVAIWLVASLVLQRWFPVFEWFGLVPSSVFFSFHIWQIFTYMFLHSNNDIFHILFNMISLWFFGSELEQRWGKHFFLTYYLVCGVGAAIIYSLVLLFYYIFTGDEMSLLRPVVGASGAVFGVLLAYAILFGDRIMYFMMIFPMKAKWMVAILGFIEVVSLFSSGLSGGVANLAHLGGLISGFLFLIFWTRFKKSKNSKRSKKSGGKLKLVVDNDPPQYWN